MLHATILVGLIQVLSLAPSLADAGQPAVDQPTEISRRSSADARTAEPGPAPQPAGDPCPEGEPCDDGLFCTVGETCTGGICGGGSPNPCDDGIDCTLDTCDEDIDQCLHTPSDTLCDDGSQCTTDSCNAIEGCVYVEDPTSTCVDLRLEPVADFLQVGQIFQVRLIARSNGNANKQVSGVSSVLTWDPAALKLLGRTDNGPYRWLLSGFLPDFDNLNEDVSPADGVPDNDGDAFYEAFSSGNAAVATPAGLLVTTLRFEALGGLLDAGTILEVVNGLPPGAPTTFSRVRGTQLGQDITGDLGHTVLHVCSAAPSDADGDGVDDCRDLCPGTVGGPVGSSGCTCAQEDCLGGEFCCDDGRFCNGLETCVSGNCVTGGAPCTDPDLPFCDERRNACVECLLDTDCADTLFCTVDEACVDGVCVTAPRNCDDAIDCTIDSCDEDGDQCLHAPDDARCDDQKPCTDDVCVQGQGCQFTPDDSNTCTDGDPCTVDACSAGDCASTAVQCPDSPDPCTRLACDPAGADGNCDRVLPDNEGGPCDDGDLCTTDQCENGACVGTSIDCTFPNDPCNTGTCNPATGACDPIPTNEGGACNDGSFCTFSDRCTAGVCTGTQIPGCIICDVDEDCDDQNPCTDGVCLFGGCVFSANSDSCDDNKPCTVNDTCSGGVCAGTQKNCSSLNNACNVGACNPATGSCEQRPANQGVPCNDGLFCTLNTKCNNGACTGASNLCDDFIPCTVDSCDDVADTCRHTPDDGLCNDQKPCTDDTCVTGVGCRFTNDDTNTCTDNDSCTSDACSAGDCVSTAVQCPDSGNACTVLACDPAGPEGNCDLQLPDNEGGPCDDGLFCTLGEMCLEGQCIGGLDNLCDDGIDCTFDSCDEVGDVCVNTPDDGQCDDLNECTDDVCIEGVGCEFTPNDENACTDGDPCTDDVCREGDCVSTAVQCPASSDDCTRLECDPDGEDGNCDLELPDNEGEPCDDSDRCTIDDACEQGTCVGTNVDCSRLNDDCNEGRCNPATGACVAAPINDGGSCDDGRFCTVDETCQAGVCGGGSDNPCDDGVDCTADTCNEELAECEHTTDNGRCDDLKFCTGEEECDDVEGCLPGTYPCDNPAEPFCDEDLDECVRCLAAGDVNGDRLVNLADYAAYAECVTGPVGPIEPPAYAIECQCLDVDGDGDIDLVDFALFQALFGRP